MPAIRRAVIYARYSTDHQSDRSIEDQVALCRDYAKREGLTVGTVYEDRARTSASLLGRDGIMNLMADARAGRFDAVIVEAFDRLSRDQEDLSGIHKRLRFAGISIFAVHDGQADVMKIGLQGLMGEMFLQQLREKTHRGLKGRVHSGQSAGGKSYGYATVPGQPGHLTIKEDEAAIVRRIYDEFGAGRSPRHIVADLNAEGITPPRGATWNASTINGHKERGYGILQNELYIGRRVWNRVKMVRDPETGKRVNRTNPRDLWVHEPVPDLRIVSDLQWDQVRHEMDRRANGPIGRAAARPKRPFSGLLRCGRCGGGMSIKKRKGSQIWLICSRSRESGTCDNRLQPRLDVIERAIFEALAQELAHPEYITAYLTAYREERERLLQSNRRDKAALERAAIRAKQTYDRSVDMYLKGVLDGDDGMQLVAEHKAEKEAAEQRLATEAPDVPKIELHPATARRHIEALASLSSDIAAGRQMSDSAVGTIRSLITQIDITPSETGQDVTVYGAIGEIIGASRSGGELVVAWGRLELPTYRL
ncbi:recombinase family protein [Loktanella atrilutea]|uniref:recombinase family protein n=1 Tax=Loktanella atrilutea TaxID=366533 RepID=UPI0009354129